MDYSPDIYDQIAEEIHEDLMAGGLSGPRAVPARYCTDCGGPTEGERCEGCEHDYQEHMRRGRFDAARSRPWQVGEGGR